MNKLEINFTNPFVEKLGEHIEHSASLGIPLAEKNRHIDDPGAVVVGLSPSLESPQTLAHIRMRAKAGWIIYAVKEGIGFLKRKGILVHYGVMMDPGDKEATRTPLYPDVTYCIASSCHPSTFEHLATCKREIFHSACGWPNEVDLYQKLFGCGDTMIGGFTVCNRALGLAAYMGCTNLELAAVAFGRREKDATKHYAKCVDYPPIDDVWMSDDGKVDGSPWLTRPDLLASAVTVAWMVKRKEVTVIGDSLANALATKPDEFLKAIVTIGKNKAVPKGLGGPVFMGRVPGPKDFRLAA